jgi:hypothetical protein
VEATVNVSNKPLLAIAAPPAQAAEFGPVSASCQISRIGDDNSGALVVTIALSGSAGPGNDFADPGTTVTIPDGSPSIDVDIDPLSDTVAEGNESVTLTLTPKNGYAVGPANQASVTIIDLPIDEWRVAKFGANANTAAIAGDLADPEFDGTANLLEFGLILEPLIVDTSQLPEPLIESGFLTMTYARRKDASISYVVSWSSSLAEGTWSEADVTEQILSEDADTEMVKAKVPLDNERKFMRVEVSR